MANLLVPHFTFYLLCASMQTSTSRRHLFSCAFAYRASIWKTSVIFASKLTIGLLGTTLVATSCSFSHTLFVQRETTLFYRGCGTGAILIKMLREESESEVVRFHHQFAGLFLSLTGCRGKERKRI